ncbi:MAG: cytochrome d ubiquinol oxidase subunit II [Elusimicrobia bacterium GWA2_61_42]|nr:MAG: cytochrome d ubiquinol oxidase subunit II [Elusimicrobia bacterium GWA2_61_42]OGR75158.1 MAG: cytochrome d ubiquinol oxidase subunit II [Elusimicrobia bacterium GWC2_61_25]
MDYAKVWFVFWAVLWAGYFALDGFDLGVGFSGWLAADGEEERRSVFASIGPFWDGNEVWLVTAGGATFAAFPAVYAGLFSWLYPALALILFSLIARGVSLEFRGKVQAAAWKSFWERTAAVSSFLAALLFGVAFGNLFRGLEIGADGYLGTFAGLLNPYALLTGLLFCAFFFFHGQLWLSFKTPAPVAGKARRLAGGAWYALLLLAVLFAAASYAYTGLSANFLVRKYLLVLPALLTASLVAAKLLLSRGDPGRAFLVSFAGIVFFALTGFAGIYPDLLPSRLDPEFGLNVYNSASSPYTLRLMTAVTAVFLPVVICYQVWVYRLFRAPLGSEELRKSGMY